jgi:signal transduction histidine kinase
MGVNGVLISYLRRHYKMILLLALFITVFAVVFSLYELPVEAVLYAAALCFVLGLVLFAIGYIRYVLHHRELRELIGRVAVSIDDLPEPFGILEKDYQELLQVLFREKTRIESEAGIDKQDMLDYFTLWVHQIKTPIAAMRLLLQAEETSQNAALSAELFKIEQYVEMVLQYLRLGSETTDFVFKACDLDGVIRQSVRKYARLFILKKLQLDFRESGTAVLTDEKWLSFVIDQILGNALKYTNAGTVSIYTEENALIIEDTGIGIRPEDLPRVFDKGFTGYNGREDKKSTGIGLYLSKRITNQLGHTLTITSTPGHGTRVRVGFKTAGTFME